MLTGFSIRNFKSLAAIPERENELLPFEPMNVLIGPNGSGKTSLLQAVGFLRAFFLSSVEVYLNQKGWNFDDLPNLRQAGKKIRWEIQANLDANSEGRCAGIYKYIVALQPRKHIGIEEEILTFSESVAAPGETLLSRKRRQLSVLDRNKKKLDFFEIIGLPASVISQMDGAVERKKYPELLHFRDWVERFRSFLIWDPKILRTASKGKHEIIGESGENLASVIAVLKERNPKQFKNLVNQVRSLFPSVSDIRVAGGGGWGWKYIELDEVHGGKKVSFNSRQTSDGVLRFLAIASLLYSDQVPSLITFEEPENGMHPQLLRAMVQMLRELTTRKSPNRCQVLFTTHNPYVLDEFFDHPEQVYCFDRSRPLSGTTVTRLSSNAQLKKIQTAFNGSLGEAWYTGLIGATAGLSES